jgi:hypothetical protein
VLIDESKGDAGNPWGIRFMTMFHMSNDSELFRTAAQLSAEGAQRNGPNWVGRDKAIWVPLYEAKMIHQFDHRWATYEDNGTDSRDMTDVEKSNPASFARPRYWIKESDKESALAGRQARPWLMGWRNIARSTDERSFIASITPRVAVGHSMPLWFIGSDDQRAAAFLGNMSALVYDYVVRHKLGGTNMTYGYYKQFPVLPPDYYTDADLEFIVPRILELTYTAHDIGPFARALGYDGPPFSWNPERRALLRAELDACYAKLYGLSRDELRYILDPADIHGHDYPSETFRVLKSNETRQFGEYRTSKLVLEAWDRIGQKAQ